MTIKELENQYPTKKYKWFAVMIAKGCSKGFPNWNYNDDDIVVDYKIEKFESTTSYHIAKENNKLVGIPTRTKPTNRLVVHWKRGREN